MDGSDAARSAFVFVTDWARQFDAKVWFIVLTSESSCRRPQIVTDFRHRGRQLANSFTVSGATRGARNQHLVSAIANAAKVHSADLIILGFNPRRLDRQRFTKGVHELLTATTDVPVLVAPRHSGPVRAEARMRPLTPIALEAPREAVGAELVLTGT